MIHIQVAPLLASYTRGATSLHAAGATLREVVADLDRQFPGIAFRVVDEQDRLRPHIRFFVNRGDVRTLDVALQEGDEVFIVGALSGG